MDSQLTSEQDIRFNLINGQEYMYCVAGAESGFKLQFKIPGTGTWMDYPGHTITASGGMSDATNVKTSTFYAFANEHRIKFTSVPTTDYWYSIQAVTMPEF